MKILRTWKQGDVCQQGSPVIAFPPEGCGCDNTSICCVAPPSECCMYNADEYASGGITVDDLPDTLELITFDVNNSQFNFIISRNGEMWGSKDPNEEGRPTGAYVEWSGDGWLVSALSGYPGGPAFCLISDKFTEDPNPNIDGYWIFDRFEDEYFIIPENPEADSSGIAARESLCVWKKEPNEGIQESDAQLFFLDSPREVGPAGWYVFTGGSSGQYRKLGSQNTPVGTYKSIVFPFEDIITVGEV